MTIEYKIDGNDFLIYQLYTASKSEQTKKRREKNKVIIPLMYLLLGLFFFWDESSFFGVIFVIFGILWFLMYPIWEKQRYIKYFKIFIKENYKERLGKIVTLELTDGYIFAKDNGSESKVLTTELEEICEIPTTIFIKLKGGQSFILPKNKISNIDSVTSRLMALADYLKIKYEVNDKWEWK